MAVDVKAVVSEISLTLAKYAALRKVSKYDDCSDQDDVTVGALVTSMAATIDRLAPVRSRYATELEKQLKIYAPGAGRNLAPLAAILTSLHDDVAAGRLLTVTELVHADLFGDFLDMAQHLLDEGYKDPAAVLAGGVLEEHLRKLSAKHSLPITLPDGRAKKAEAMNAELAGAAAYSKSDLKNVTAWLALRNSAAHAKYDEYTRDQVSLLVQSVRDFITRVPA